MKTKKRSRSSNTAWTEADHAVRSESQKRTEKQQRRIASLSHDTKEKRDETKLRLHLTKTRREVARLKERLENWDPQEEAEEKKKAAQVEDNPPPPKKKGRKGPETWKLKGAARPAWQVYEFDTRHVDPHMQAHKFAQEKAGRSQNLLAIYKGQFASRAPEIGRQYLGQLMQLGHLSQDARQYKAARAAWLEVIDLEGDDPITTARECLMRMYVGLERYDAALRLGERFVGDSSVWIRYSLALVALKQGKNDTDRYMVDAIKANPLCAYYLAFYDTFSTVMEYIHDIEEAEDEPQSSLEEAIEYCASDQVKEWRRASGTMTLRNLLIRGLQGSHGKLDVSDLDWSDRLSKIEEEYKSRTTDSAADYRNLSNDAIDNEEEAGANEIDLSMFVGMYRTAMEMIEESGQLGSLPQED